jgi:hypothetical protein
MHNKAERKAIWLTYFHWFHWLVGVVCTSLWKLVWTKFRNANLRKVRTDYTNCRGNEVSVAAWITMDYTSRGMWRNVSRRIKTLHCIPLEGLSEIFGLVETFGRPFNSLYRKLSNTGIWGSYRGGDVDGVLGCDVDVTLCRLSFWRNLRVHTVSQTRTTSAAFRYSNPSVYELLPLLRNC